MIGEKPGKHFNLKFSNYGFLQVEKIPDTEKFGIVAYYNYINKENYFLKASGKKNGKFKGDSIIGSSFQAIKTEINGDKHPIVANQLIGVTGNRLNLPYVFIGLGRINNYIEDLTFGVPKPELWSNSWTPIIPNSQLMITPSHENPTKWKIEIFINPTEALWIIIISTIGVLLILGVAIVYFHIKEKEEDKKDMENNYDIF